MKRLILMRHAKSSWGDAAQEDFDRVLNGRGRRSATALGDWVRGQNIGIDQALVSSAARTQETFARLSLECDVSFLDHLYLAETQVMVAALHKATGDNVLMLGHNPGIAGMAQSLLAQTPNHPRFDDYPTGATLVATFDIAQWSDLAMRSGLAQAFVTARDLSD